MAKELIIEQSIRVGRKQYPYTLRPVGDDLTYVKCEAAGIDQEFANEDLLELIMDLPNTILENQKFEKEQVLRFRCSAEERKEIARRAMQRRFPTVSAFLRSLALAGELSPSGEFSPKAKKELKKILAKTK